MSSTLPTPSGPILSVGEEPHDFQIHFDAITAHFSPIDPFEVRQVELIAYCDLDIDRNRRRMQSYVERAIDEYAHEIAPMFDTEPPIEPQTIMTRAATCAYVDHSHVRAKHPNGREPTATTHRRPRALPDATQTQTIRGR